MKKNLNWFSGFLAANLVITFLISLLYLATPSTHPANLGAALFVGPYFVGHMGFLLIALSLPFLFLSLFLAGFKPLQWLMGCYFAFIQAVLLIDTFVYQQYRFHINFFVLDLFFNGQGQIISFAWYMWALVFGFIAFVAGFEIWMAHKIYQRSSGLNLQLTRRFFGVWFLCVLVSQLIHGFADAHFYRPITNMGTIPPFPAPLNAQDTLAKYGLVDVEAQKSKALMSLADEEKSLVQYPLKDLKCQIPKEKLNVLFILLDSVRYDALNEKVMPHTFALQSQSTVFKQHFSGSNSTRGGVFSYFYGLPPLYFDKFKEGHISAVMMDQFLKNDYDTQILSSAPLTKPEFDQTVFSKIPNLRKKSKASEAYLRDREITDEWLSFMKDRNPQKPFVGFLFYDAAHEFSNDPSVTPFKPYLKQINYFTLNNSTDPTEFLNRYWNSIYFIDTELDRVFKDLETRGVLKNTIVVFSSDHGKEFNDNKLNYWGHNSNFTDAQTHVPFFIHWPGRPPGEVNHWTSHYDLPATIMEELFACENPASDYSSGENLFKGKGHQWLLHGTYGDFGIRLKDHFIVIKLNGSFDVLDLHYKPTSDIQVDYGVYNKALQEMRRFYK